MAHSLPLDPKKRQQKGAQSTDLTIVHVLRANAKRLSEPARDNRGVWNEFSALKIT